MHSDIPLKSEHRHYSATDTLRELEFHKVLKNITVNTLTYFTRIGCHVLSSLTCDDLVVLGEVFSFSPSLSG